MCTAVPVAPVAFPESYVTTILSRPATGLDFYATLLQHHGIAAHTLLRQSHVYKSSGSTAQRLVSATARRTFTVSRPENLRVQETVIRVVGYNAALSRVICLSKRYIRVKS